MHLDPLALKANSKFEILLAKIFGLKQKTTQILPAALGKIKFCFLTKQPHVALDKGLQCGNVKQKSFRQT